jgi:hypothetical protein
MPHPRADSAVTPQLLLLELNEVNFEYIRAYCELGLLPNLRELIARHGVAQTTSEDIYEHQEPWIQWVTAHTGKSFAEHGVFRLGDIVKRDIPQIWEMLEEKGLRVGAVSPMNAKHRLRSPEFFVPDPWTATDITAPFVLKRLYRALSQAVSDNASDGLTMSSAANLLLGAACYARSVNYPSYVRLAASSSAAPWRRAMFLDLLLADVFIKECKRTRPNFASLFLNAAAHIQHHYLFCARPYKGASRNPRWYVDAEVDPVCEIYQLYDRVIGQVRTAFPQTRLMLATGLHQVPHECVTYYWRLRRHNEFLRRIRIPFRHTEPRMSRDFLVVCSSASDAVEAARRLREAVTANGIKLFEVENRGTDLFVMLTYPEEIGDRLPFRIGQDDYFLAKDDVAFVALKNGEHSGIGYFVDSGSRLAKEETQFPLAELPERITAAFAGASVPETMRAGT